MKIVNSDNQLAKQLRKAKDLVVVCFDSKGSDTDKKSTDAMRNAERALKKNVSFIKADSAGSKEASAFYGLDQKPGFILFNGENVVARSEGVMDGEALTTWVEGNKDKTEPFENNPEVEQDAETEEVAVKQTGGISGFLAKNTYRTMLAGGVLTSAATATGGVLLALTAPVSTPLFILGAGVAAISTLGTLSKGMKLLYQDKSRFDKPRSFKGAFGQVRQALGGYRDNRGPSGLTLMTRTVLRAAGTGVGYIVATSAAVAALPFVGPLAPQIGLAVLAIGGAGLLANTGVIAKRIAYGRPEFKPDEVLKPKPKIVKAAKTAEAKTPKQGAEPKLPNVDASPTQEDEPKTDDSVTALTQGDTPKAETFEQAAAPQSKTDVTVKPEKAPADETTAEAQETQEAPVTPPVDYAEGDVQNVVAGDELKPDGTTKPKEKSSFPGVKSIKKLFSRFGKKDKAPKKDATPSATKTPENLPAVIGPHTPQFVGPIKPPGMNK